MAGPWQGDATQYREQSVRHRRYSQAESALGVDARATAAAGGPAIQPSAYDAVRARKVGSDGLVPNTDTPLTSDLVEGADIIFVMEKAHRTKLASKFKNSLNGPRVICLSVPDRPYRDGFNFLFNSGTHACRLMPRYVTTEGRKKCQ
jgi:predicted protein tyrosine phosphatase